MELLFSILYILLTLVQVVLIARVIFDVVQQVGRDWRPRGFALVVASAVYSLTDPLLERLRRSIPPVQLGGVALDLSILILFVAVLVLKVVARVLALA